MLLIHWQYEFLRCICLISWLWSTVDRNMLHSTVMACLSLAMAVHVSEWLFRFCCSATSRACIFEFPVLYFHSLKPTTHPSSFVASYCMCKDTSDQRIMQRRRFGRKRLWPIELLTRMYLEGVRSHETLSQQPVTLQSVKPGVSRLQFYSINLFDICSVR
jgi:hypothetical protein